MTCLRNIGTYCSSIAACAQSILSHVYLSDWHFLSCCITVCVRTLTRTIEPPTLKFLSLLPGYSYTLYFDKKRREKWETNILHCLVNFHTEFLFYLSRVNLAAGNMGCSKIRQPKPSSKNDFMLCAKYLWQEKSLNFYFPLEWEEVAFGMWSSSSSKQKSRDYIC